MDSTAQKNVESVVFGAEPANVADAFRWMDAALTWFGYTFEGDDTDGDPLTLVTTFHWDTRGEDIRHTSNGRSLARARQRAYDVGAESAFTLIDQSWNAPGGAYAAAMDVQPCPHCKRLLMWLDSAGWVHVDHTAPDCWLHGSYPV